MDEAPDDVMGRVQVGLAALGLALAVLIAASSCADQRDITGSADENIRYIEYVDPVIPVEDLASVGSEAVIGTVRNLREVRISEDPVVLDGVQAPRMIDGHLVADVAIAEVLRGESEAGSTVSVLYEDILAEGVEVGDSEYEPLTLKKGQRLFIAGDLVAAEEFSADGEVEVLVPHSASTVATVNRGEVKSRVGGSVRLGELRRIAREHPNGS